MNRKAYVAKCWMVDTPEGRRSDYSFNSKVEGAMWWPSQEEADAECLNLERDKIRISSALGDIHTISGFKTEQRKPGEFVISCEAPFIEQSRLNR